MDKFIEKLVGILASIGLDEDKINEVVAKLSDTTPDEVVEENPKEGDPADQPNEQEDQQPTPPTPVEEEGAGNLPPSDEPAPVDAPTVLAEGDVPPTDQTQPPVPPFDPTQLIEQISGLSTQLDEVKKANEGLVARCGALEEALKKAGVIEEGSTTTQVGDPLPSAAPQSPTDDVLADVLSELNGRR